MFKSQSSFKRLPNETKQKQNVWTVGMSAVH